MDRRPIWLDEYANIIDDVRNKINSITVVEDKTFEYAIIRLFSKTTLIMCEIYTLMNNGYPHGALALSRQVYESIVIMDYITSHKQDSELFERLFDDEQISLLRIIDKKEKFLGKSETSICATDIEYYKKKYPNFINANGEFSDYWWVKKGYRFADIAQQTRFKKNYMYQETSDNIHMSLHAALICVGRNQDGIFIGQTYDGIERAGWYSMLCYCVVLDIFENAINIEFNDIDDILDRMQKLTTKIRLKLFDNE